MASYVCLANDSQYGALLYWKERDSNTVLGGDMYFIFLVPRSSVYCTRGEHLTMFGPPGMNSLIRSSTTTFSDARGTPAYRSE